MTTIPVWLPYRQPSIWDQHLLFEAIRGFVWPLHGVTFDVSSAPPENGNGAIIIASGYEMLKYGPHALDDQIAALPWFLFIHTSDEMCRFESADLLKVSLNPRRRWQQYVDVQNGAYRNIHIGYPPGTIDIIRDLPRLPLSERRLWAFSGQAFSAARQQMVAELSRANRGTLAISKGFGQGLPHAGHLSLLAGAALAPCPVGGSSPDSFRLYEALEAGCLPICDKRVDGWAAGSNFWRKLSIDGAQFPTVDSWKEWPELLRRYSENMTLAQTHANKAGAWWQGWKRQLVHNLIDDALALSGQKAEYDMDSLAGKVTILVTTSPIPSNPDTEMIARTLRALRLDPALAGAEVLILCDGVRAEQEHRRGSYEEFKRRLLDLCKWTEDFAGCLPIIFDEHQGQGLMVRRALEQHLKTPLVLVCEHDMWPIEGSVIDWLGIARALDPGTGYNQIRLTLDAELLPSRAHNAVAFVDGNPYVAQDVGGVPLVRTREYSSRIHMARADWYREKLPPQFGYQSRAHLEHGLYGASTHEFQSGAPWEKWGMAIYAPDPVPRGMYVDGRQGDPMFEPKITGE